MKTAIRPIVAVILWLASQSAVPSGSAFAQICRPFPPDGTRIFDVVRHEQILGEARYDFSRDTENLVVRVDTNYAIGPAEAPFYQFEHHSEEIWQGGRMRAIISDTKDNGRRYRLRMGWDGKQLDGTSNGIALAVSGLAVPSSLWHRDTPKSEALISVVDGAVLPIQVHALGETSIRVNGRPMTAHGYILVGAFERKVWYDEACQLVRAAFVGFDGRELTLELRSAPEP